MKLKPLFYIFLLGILSYSGFWFYLAQNIKPEIHKITRTLEEKGVYLSYDNIGVSGFPYRLIVNFENPQFSLRQGFINLHWREGDLALYLQPWNLTHLIFTGSDGKVTFGSNPNKPNAKTLSPQSFRASFITADGAEKRMSLEIKDSQFTNGSNPLTTMAFQAINLHVKLSESLDDPGTDLYESKLGDVFLSLQGLTVFGQENLETPNSFTLSLTPRGPDIPLFTHEGLSNWRDQGSTVDINEFSLNWFEGQAFGEGSITLDEELRPLGILSGTFENPKLITDFLRFTGFVDTVQSDRISSGLTTMASLFGDKTGTKSPFSISAQEGGLWLGSIKFKDILPVVK